MSVIENHRKRREFSDFPSTSAITPGGLGVRLLRYFVSVDGKMIFRPGDREALCRFRHLIKGVPHLVQLISAQPSSAPSKWDLKFVDVNDLSRFVTMTVDEPAFKIKLPKPQPAYS